MIKVNQSAIHEFQNIFLFRGKELSAGGNFLYEESSVLFGKEILAPNLIEYQKEDEAQLDFKSGAIKGLLSKIKIDDQEFINLVDIRLGKVQHNADLDLSYDKSLFSTASVHAIQGALTGHTGFKVNILEDLLWTIAVKNIDIENARYLQVQIAEDFVSQRSSRLSQELAKSFSSDRYVDTHILSFMLMTMVSGSSKKVYFKKGK